MGDVNKSDILCVLRERGANLAKHLSVYEMSIVLSQKGHNISDLVDSVFALKSEGIIEFDGTWISLKS
jgi:hypothetical protein